MQKIFVNEFASWLGLDLSKFDVDYSAGATQSFDSFYLRHRDKHFCCFTGEYFYHLKTWISNNINWSFIQHEDELTNNSALVISYPFCDTGNFYYLENILDKCDQLQIPVLLDMAYYPLTNTPGVEFTHNCIDTVAFSLSKTFPVANYRIGVRYTKKNIYDGQKLHDDINYNNFASCYLGYKLIQEFPVNYIAQKYRNMQQEVCDTFQLEPSDSVIFALGNSEWDICRAPAGALQISLLDAYKLDINPKLFENRICLNPVYENWRLFNELKITL